MKKICLSFITPLCLLGVLVFPESGFAFMTSLSETGMRSVTAQAGIVMSTVEDVDFNMEIDTIAYGDTGLNPEESAFLSFNDIILEGAINSDKPVSVGVSTELNPYTGFVDTGVSITMTEVEIDIDHFEIGSITIGSMPGEGASFGKFTLSDYHARISGNIRITTH